MPKTPLPAAGEAIAAADFSRRTILTGLGAVTAAAVTIRQAESSGLVDAGGFPRGEEDPMNMIVSQDRFRKSVAHPDAELFTLEKEMKDAHTRMVKAQKAYNAAEEKCFKAYPPRPADREEPPMPDHISDMVGNMRMADFRRPEREPEPVREWYTAREKEKAANKAEWDAYWAKCEEIDREAEPFEEAFEERINELMEIGGRILKIPASTFEGMTIKIRADEMMDLQGSGSRETFLSIATDIKRLAATSA